MSDGRTSDLARFAGRTAIVILLAGLAFIAWELAPVLIAGFGGILFAVVFRRLGLIITRHTPLNETWSVGLVLGLLGLMAAAGTWLFGSQLANQFEELASTLRDAVQTLNEWLGDRGIDIALSDLSESVMAWVTSIGNMLWQMISGALLVVFILIYLAINPDVYRQGLILLFPRRLHRDVEEVLDAMGTALWRWTAGQFISMSVIAVLTTLALWLLDVPLALLLGLIAGLLEFIPIIGPIIAAVPALLVAFTVDPTTALWVLVSYVAIQQVESWIVSPLAQRAAVALPPAVNLMAVAAFGLLFGIPGLLFAAPLALVVIVFVRMVFVRDVLDQDLPDSRLPPASTDSAGGDSAS